MAMLRAALLLAAALGCAAMHWDAASSLRYWQGLALVDSEGFRPSATRTFGLFGNLPDTCNTTDRSPLPTYDCARLEVRTLTIRSPGTSHSRSSHRLVVAAFTRSVERSLAEAAGKQSICALVGSDDPAVAQAEDEGELVVFSETFSLREVRGSGGEEYFVSLSGVAELGASDLWIVSVALCGLAPGSGPVALHAEDRLLGDVVVMSSTGHLTAGLYSLMEFHLYDAIALLAFAAVWAAFGVWKRQSFSVIHAVLLLMAVLLAIQQFMWYNLYETSNQTSTWGDVEMYFVIVFRALCKVLWCFLQALLVHGYRSLYPTLVESNIRTIAIVTSVYFVVCMLAVFDDPREEQSSFAKVVAGVQALADLLIYLWCFAVLHSLIEKRGLENKRGLFVALYRLLIFYLTLVVVAAVVMGIVRGLMSRSQLEAHWRTLWVMSIVMPLIFQIALVLLMVVWRPSEQTKYLFYAVELQDDEEDAVHGVVSGVADTELEETAAPAADARGGGGGGGGGGGDDDDHMFSGIELEENAFGTSESPSRPAEKAETPPAAQPKPPKLKAD